MENNKKKVMPPARRTGKKARLIAAVIAVALIIGGVAAGSTLAWFTDVTAPVVNTFTVGNIDIDLTEDAPGKDMPKEFKMIPGHTITKDPVATVKAGSEDCYLFVELTEDLGSWETYSPSGTSGDTYSFRELLSYTIAADWTPLVDANNDGYADNGVYYREVPTSDADQPFNVLQNNTVSVSYVVTKQMMDMLNATGAELPTLSVKAYAVQLYETNGVKFDPDEAWGIAKPSTP